MKTIVRIIALAAALFASSLAAQPAEPIAAYLDMADKKVQVERTLSRYTSSRGSDEKYTTGELRPLFDAAFEAAAASKETQNALDEHWLVVNGCLKAMGRGACEADLGAAKAKVELKWGRAKP